MRHRVGKAKERKRRGGGGTYLRHARLSLQRTDKLLCARAPCGRGRERGVEGTRGKGSDRRGVFRVVSNLGGGENAHSQKS